MNERLSSLLMELQQHPALPEIAMGLERMEALLAALGQPQRKLPPTIHVAGTNGKGSTIAFLRAIYEAAGYRVHVYSSPHLVRFHERIVLAGGPIEDAALLDVLERVKAVALPATFFEATTAAAMLAFAEAPADVLLMEVGLGGRLDATNVDAPIIASVITPIGIDHREYLGDSLAGIAAEKAGIMRPRIPCVSAPQSAEVMEVLTERALALPCPLVIAATEETLPLALVGEHQRVNAGVAVEVAATLAERFPLTKQQVADGLSQAQWPARLQRLKHGPIVDAWGSPVLLDGGHNAHAATALAAWVDAQPAPVVMLCGMMRRKEASAYFAALEGKLARIACVAIPGAEDSFSAAELAAMAPAGEAFASISEAVASLRAVGGATLLIAGSLYLAGEILKTHG